MDLEAKPMQDFQEGIARLWSWVASIYWRSPEGFASYLQEPAAMEALRHEELVRVGASVVDLSPEERQ